MKRILLAGIVALGCVAVSGTVLAANQATGNTTAYVLQPLNITAGGLDFGTIGTNGAACTVTQAPIFANSHLRTGTCYLDPADDGNEGDWNVTGENNHAYTLTMITIDGANNITAALNCGDDIIIEVDSWRVASNDGTGGFTGGSTEGGDSDSGTRAMLIDGPGGPNPNSDPFNLGATAHLVGTQCPGSYSGAMTLQATYL